ncbi:MAG: hypothetical protein AB1726_00955 [Planctomycetota bacterium]
MQMQPPGCPRRGPDAGLTALELSMMIAVFLVGLLAFSQSVRNSVDLGATSQESALATEAARMVIERMQGTPFAEVHARFDADPANDPGGGATAPGSLIAIPGLDLRRDDADGAAGEIVFPTEDGFDPREDVPDDELGMPRDLNLDGAIDSLDHAGDYRILPILVRIEWRGTTGDRSISFKTILAER